MNGSNQNEVPIGSGVHSGALEWKILKSFLKIQYVFSFMNPRQSPDEF